MPDWLLQAIIANWVWELLVIAAGLMFGWLRHKNVSWLPVLFYGLTASTCMAVLIYTFIGRAIISRSQPETTAENIESNVKVWADAFGVGIQKQADPGFSFIFALHLRNGRVVLIGRPKERDHFLTLQSTLVLGSDQQTVVDKLSKEQNQRIVDEVTLELARSRMGHAIAGLPLKTILLAESVPITNSFTEDNFAARLDEMDAATELADKAATLAIQRAKH